MSTDFKLRVPSEYYSGNSSKYSITQKYDIKRGHAHSVIVFRRKAFPQIMRLDFTFLDTLFLGFSPFRISATNDIAARSLTLSMV